MLPIPTRVELRVDVSLDGSCNSDCCPRRLRRTTRVMSLPKYEDGDVAPEVKVADVAKRRFCVML